MHVSWEKIMFHTLTLLDCLPRSTGLYKMTNDPNVILIISLNATFSNLVIQSWPGHLVWNITLSL